MALLTDRDTDGANGLDKENAEEVVEVIIAPSLLSADFGRLAEDAARMKTAGADWLHFDVMDGNFVPNLSFGACVLKSLRKHTDAFIDCHLMVVRPEVYVEPFAAAGASNFTFHLEACEDRAGLARTIREKGMTVGVAIKPSTGVEELFDFVDTGLVDMVLVMTVEPGFGGQKFMSAMLDKVKVLRERYSSLKIQVDGGLGPSTIDAAAAAGANVIVAGSAIFGAEDPHAVIAQMKQSVIQHAHRRRE